MLAFLTTFSCRQFLIDLLSFPLPSLSPWWYPHWKIWWKFLCFYAFLMSTLFHVITHSPMDIIYFFCINNIIVNINLILLIINIIINSTIYLRNNIHCYFDFYCCEVLVFLISSSASSLMTWLYSAISSLQIFSKLLSLEIWSQFDSLLSLFPSWLVS